MSETVCLTFPFYQTDGQMDGWMDAVWSDIARTARVLVPGRPAVAIALSTSIHICSAPWKQIPTIHCWKALLCALRGSVSISRSCPRNYALRTQARKYGLIRLGKGKSTSRSRFYDLPKEVDLWARLNGLHLSIFLWHFRNGCRKVWQSSRKAQVNKPSSLRGNRILITSQQLWKRRRYTYSTPP